MKQALAKSDPKIWTKRAFPRTRGDPGIAPGHIYLSPFATHFSFNPPSTFSRDTSGYPRSTNTPTTVIQLLSSPRLCVLPRRGRDLYEAAVTAQARCLSAVPPARAAHLLPPLTGPFPVTLSPNNPSPAALCSHIQPAARFDIHQAPRKLQPKISQKGDSRATRSDGIRLELKCVY